MGTWTRLVAFTPESDRSRIVHTMAGDDWTRLAVTSLWWMVLPLAAGVWRLLRSKVT